MPAKPILLKVYVPRSYAIAVDQVAAELRLSKSLLLREAVRRGLPALVNDVALLRSQGFRPAAHLAGMPAAYGRRGSVGGEPEVARWSKVPGDFAEETEIAVAIWFSPRGGGDPSIALVLRAPGARRSLAVGLISRPWGARGDYRCSR